MEMGYSGIDMSIIFSEITQQIKYVLQEQVKIIETHKSDMLGKDYCKAFVTLYVNEAFRIAEDKKTYSQKRDDMFKGKNACVCITSVKLCAIMRAFYEDDNISIQAVTKQFRNNGFLQTDKSKKSSKKVGKERYLHIKESMIAEYCHFLM